MLSTMVGFHDQLRLDDPSVLARTISVDTLSVRPTDFDIDPQTQVSLYENGRRAATDFLDGVGGLPGWDSRAVAATASQGGSVKRWTSDNVTPRLCSPQLFHMGRHPGSAFRPIAFSLGPATDGVLP
jgi:hypothetical protein